MRRRAPRRSGRLGSAGDGDPAAGRPACCSGWSWRSGGRRRRASTSSTPPRSAPVRPPAPRRRAVPAPLAADVVDRSLAQHGMTCAPPAVDRHVHARRAGHGHGHVHRRPRRRHPVRLHPRVADADRDGERGHRPHEGWVMAARLRGSTATSRCSSSSCSRPCCSPPASCSTAVASCRSGATPARLRPPAARGRHPAVRAGDTTAPVSTPAWPPQRASAELASQGVDRVGGRHRPVGHGDRHGAGRLPHPPRWPVRLVELDGHAGRGRRRSGAMNARAARGALGAIAATGLLVVGVPLLFVVFVGNPWPGRTRLELGDEVGARRRRARRAGVAGLVALRRRRRRRSPRPGRRAATCTVRPSVRPAAAGPPRRRAARPAAGRRGAHHRCPIAPRVDDRRRPRPDGTRRVRRARRRTGSAAAGTVGAASRRRPGHGRRPATPCSAWPGPISATPSAGGRSSSSTVTARSPTAGGLTSPSIIRAGWTLVLPAGAAMPAPSPSDVPRAGDGHDRDRRQPVVAVPRPARARRRAPTTTPPWPATSQSVVAANPDVVEDPNLIFPGEQFDFPAVGTPPPPPPPPPPAPPPPPPTALAPAWRRPRSLASGRARAGRVRCRHRVAPVDHGPDTSTARTAPAVDRARGDTRAGAPSPVGFGEAALLSAGVLALLASRRRAAPASIATARPRPRAAGRRRWPPSAGCERVDAGERLAARRRRRASRGRLARRHDGRGSPSSAVGTDGVVELTLTGDADAPGAVARWRTDVVASRDRRRSSCSPTPPAPSARHASALTQLGVDADGGEVLADLEALGVLAVDAPAPLADAVVRGVAATLATSVFAEIANLVGVGIDEAAFLDHRHAHVVDSVDERPRARRHPGRHDCGRPSRARSCCAPGTRVARRGSRRSC